MNWLWITLAAIGYVGIWTAVSACYYKPLDKGSDDPLAGAAVLGSVWPLWLALAIIASPFFAVGWIVKHTHRPTAAEREERIEELEREAGLR
ncbi:MAG TPA: hypothetical protein VFJ14_11355 [Nocardioidaceae bacterium]|nr:hypothetical protein [Nocardioidaceae bacterium]